MKKILYLGLLFSLSPCLLKAESFKGPYLGVQTSLNQRQDSTKSPAFQSNQGGGTLQMSSIDATKRKSYMLYGFLGGMGHRFSNDFYLGTEASFETHNFTSKNLYTYALQWGCPVLGGPVHSHNTKATLSTKFERGKILGLTLRGGKVLENDLLLYGKIGLEHSKDTLMLSYSLEGPHQETVTIDKRIKKSKILFVPGIGLEKSLGTFSLRAEYNYNPGSSLKRDSDIADVQETHSYYAHILKAALVYHF